MSSAAPTPVPNTFADRRSLRFADAAVESAFQRQYFRDNVRYVRAALAIGIVAWGFYGIYTAPSQGHTTFVLIHLSAIAVTTAVLALTLVVGAESWWQGPVSVLIVVSSVLSEAHRVVFHHRADWTGVVSMMLILAFAYALLRLHFASAAIAGALAIVAYDVARVAVRTPTDIGLVEPTVDLAAFAVVGSSAAWALERFARLLFVRERELDRERQRGDALLRNILPEPIIGRLKGRQLGRDDGRVADAFADVTVLFADLVGFTVHAATLDPEELVVTLERVFGLWDGITAGRGLEKIKTIGDAYMAAAGVPTSRPDHVEAAAEAGLAMQEAVRDLRWPAGPPMSARIGIACGPVVAGVIGHRKFAYDIWGDTVNAASRLESTAAPGAIRVSEAVYRRLGSTYVFSDARVVDLKGMGPTPVRTLIGRASTDPSTSLPPARERSPGARRSEGARVTSGTR